MTRKRVWGAAVGVGALILTGILTNLAVRRAHRPGQLDVLTAQAMDMAQMRPPTGAAEATLGAVRAGAVGQAVTYTGAVQAFNEQDITARVTGRLVSLPVYPGDRVRAGQTLARLDTAELAAKTAMDAGSLEKMRQEAVHARHGVTQKRTEVAEAQARVAAARETIPLAQAEVDAARQGAASARADIAAARAQADYWDIEIAREKQLAATGAASRQEYQNELASAQAAQAALSGAQAKARQAEAMVAQARVKVSQARKDVAIAQAAQRAAQAALATTTGEVPVADAALSEATARLRAARVVEGYAQISAPFDGVITARPAAPGTLLQPGQMIVKMAQLGKVRLQANVAVADMDSIRVGSPVSVLLPESRRALSAHVTSVFPSANTQTRTATVEAVVPNPDGRLLPGAFVTMRFVRPAAPSALLVPAAAVVSEGGASFVWLASGSAAAGAVVTKYKAQGCGMTYSATDAKKYNYVCPMDGSKLVALGGAAATGTAMTARRVPVTPGASDGVWTDVSGANLSPGEQVVTHGQAGLTDGAALQAENAPRVAVTKFKAQGCGMTYSAADAKKYHYICPMDGSKLTAVKS